MRTLHTIFVHCAATRPNWMAGSDMNAKVAEIRRWHVQDRGWSDIGYHYLIDRDGTVLPGRPLERMGAHARGHNEGSVGVCLLGGHGSNEADAFEDHYTTQQDDALRGLISEIQGKYGTMKVRGHNEVAAKACPGFNVQRWLKYRAPRRESVAQSTTVQAAAGTVLTTGTTAVAAVGSLEGPTQIAVIVGAVTVVLMAMWIMRERILQFARGVR